MAALRYAALLSSLVIRLLSYIFLRWIPGHFPNLILAAFTVYLSSIVLDSGLYKQPARAKDHASRAGARHEQSKNSSLWRSLISGIPLPDHRPLSYSTAVINALLVLMVLDFTFWSRYMQPSHDLVFSRVGYVSKNTARIIVRDPSAVSEPLQLQYRPAYQELDNFLSQWQHLPKAFTTAENEDYIALFELDNLQPNTTYEYRVSNDHAGHFKTATSVTTESAHDEPFTFLHSSCMIPNFPYKPLRHHLEVPGFKYLAAKLPQLKAKFMIFLGDFIYIDVPHRFGTDKETYRREYRQLYASPDWQSVTQQKDAELSWIHVYDDHEIANDWDKNETGVYSSAADPWQNYQASANPPPHRDGVSYFSFAQGPVAFFLMDTRRYRTPFDGTNGTWDEHTSGKSMLGQQQRTDLIDWLTQEEPAHIKWKVVISSVPFTKNWRFGSEDTWAGYLGERKAVLEVMWEASSQQSVGIVILSGDRHEFAATAFPPPISGPNALRWPVDATVHEFSASPLSMFYLPVRTYRQEDDEDVMLQYLPDGNSKFGSLTIKTSQSSQSVLYYQLFIDGEEAWTHTLTTPGDDSTQKPQPPVPAQKPQGLSWFGNGSKIRWAFA